MLRTGAARASGSAGDRPQLAGNTRRRQQEAALRTQWRKVAVRLELQCAAGQVQGGGPRVSMKGAVDWWARVRCRGRASGG